MRDGLVKVFLAVLLICLNGAGRAEDGIPPFPRSYAIDVQVCPEGVEAPKPENCRSLRLRERFHGFRCTDAISPGQPLMTRLLAASPALYGLTSRDFRVTLTCVEIARDSFPT